MRTELTEKYKGHSNKNETDEKEVSKLLIISKVIDITVNTFIPQSMPLWKKDFDCLGNHDYT